MGPEAAMDMISELGEELRGADDFEGASDALLRAGRRVLRSMIAAARVVADVHPGSVCLNPETSRVAVHAPDGGDALAISRSAWRLVVRHGCPIVLSASGQATLFLRTGVETRQLVQGATRQGLIERAVSHLHVNPLFGPGGPIGTLSFPVQYHSLIDFEDVDDDPDFLERSMMLAQMTAGRFPLLPRRRQPDTLCDVYVPVAGARTLGLLEHLARYVDRPEPLMLLGPVGAGRTHLAQWCHARSGRTGALERFEPSAEGAQVDRLMQAWEAAREGTLLLAHPERLDALAQERLLALCTGEASDAPRLIVRTDARWEAVSRQETLDPELAARLQEFVVRVSPLRARPEEIVGWAQRFALLAGGGVTFSEAARRFLQARSWNDNLIGLRQAVNHARDLALSESSDPLGVAIIDRAHLARAPSIGREGADQSRQEAVLLDGLDAIAEVLINAGDLAHGAPIEGIAGLALWRLSAQVGGRKEALAHIARTPSNGNASRTWTRKMKPAIQLAEALGLEELAAALRQR